MYKTNNVQSSMRCVLNKVSLVTPINPSLESSITTSCINNLYGVSRVSTIETNQIHVCETLTQIKSLHNANSLTNAQFSMPQNDHFPCPSLAIPTPQCNDFPALQIKADHSKVSDHSTSLLIHCVLSKPHKCKIWYKCNKVNICLKSMNEQANGVSRIVL